MRAEFINPFMTATINVLETMASVQAQPGRPHLKQGTKSYSDVTGLIGLAGEGIEGSFAISFTEACILRIVSNMLGEEITDLDGDIADAVGEITNMISGGARAALDQQGYSFRMALPTVVTQRGHTVSLIAHSPVIVIPFTTAAGPFFTEACLRTGN
jgi:chemotaxis protein CheX